MIDNVYSTCQIFSKKKVSNKVSLAVFFTVLYFFILEFKFEIKLYESLHSEGTELHAPLQAVNRKHLSELNWFCERMQKLQCYMLQCFVH